jgi:hypothetical protein
MVSKIGLDLSDDAHSNARAKARAAPSAVGTNTPARVSQSATKSQRACDKVRQLVKERPFLFQNLQPRPIAAFVDSRTEKAKPM